MAPQFLVLLPNTNVLAALDELLTMIAKVSLEVRLEKVEIFQTVPVPFSVMLELPKGVKLRRNPPPVEKERQMIGTVTPNGDERVPAVSVRSLFVPRSNSSMFNPSIFQVPPFPLKTKWRGTVNPSVSIVFVPLVAVNVKVPVLPLNTVDERSLSLPLIVIFVSASVTVVVETVKSLQLTLFNVTVLPDPRKSMLGRVMVVLPASTVGLPIRKATFPPLSVIVRPVTVDVSQAVPPSCKLKEEEALNVIDLVFELLDVNFFAALTVVVPMAKVIFPLVRRISAGKFTLPPTSSKVQPPPAPSKIKMEPVAWKASAFFILTTKPVVVAEKVIVAFTCK